MKTCISCGAEIGEDQEFCTQCGNPADQAAVPAANTNGIPDITWMGKAPLVKNPEVLRGYLLLFVVIFILGGLLSIITANIYVLYMFLAIVIVLVFLFLLISFVIESATRGGLEIQGHVSEEGVGHSVGKTARNITRSGLILGSIAALGGSRSGTVVMGGSLISLSHENSSIRWQDIRSVKTYPNERLIVIRDMSMINPVALYCTDGNFDQVLAIIRNRAPAGTKFS